MAYRDETERLRARVEELERELERANRRIASFERSTELERRSLADRLLGAPVRVVREVTVDGELNDAALPEIERTLNSRLGLAGQARWDGANVTWTGGSAELPQRVNVTLSVADGRTRIVASEDVGNYAVILMGVGAALVIVTLSNLRHTDVAIWLVLGALFAALLAFRVAYSLFVARRERALANVVRDLAAIAAPEVAEHPPRVRVEDAEAGEHAEEEPAKDVERSRRMR